MVSLCHCNMKEKTLKLFISRYFEVVIGNIYELPFTMGSGYVLPINKCSNDLNTKSFPMNLFVFEEMLYCTKLFPELKNLNLKNLCIEVRRKIASTT